MLKHPQQISNRTHSYWIPSSRTTSFASLKMPISIDVAIVGAGIAGLSAAYYLTKAGKKVAIFDDGLVFSGESSRTSAHLASYIDGPIAILKDKFGLEKTRTLLQGHKNAINSIEEIAKTENIECEFKRVSGYLFCLNENKDLLREAEALKSVGVLGFEWVDRAPITTIDTGRCLKIYDQAQFHPIKYMEGLLQALVPAGAKIFENTHIADIKDGTPCILASHEGVEITAKDVIIATHSPVNDRISVHTKQAQYRTYIVGVSIAKNTVEEALYWDTQDPYHYIRTVHSPRLDRDYLIIGGEDHKVGQRNETKALLRLKHWINEQFPEHENIYEWSGQIIEPADRIGFAGLNPNSRHIYVLTGSAGSGLTHGVMGASLITDLILGKSSFLVDILSPSRKAWRAPIKYIKEAFSMIWSYSDWLKPNLLQEEKLLPHEGAVIRRGFSHHAIYKDKNGKLHEMSAVCPHLGGIVRWNDLEETWDCPCHGSRFSSNGEVIHGPANCGLTKTKRLQK